MSKNFIKLLHFIEKNVWRFLVSYFEQCQDDYTFITFAIVEFITLFIGWLMKVNKLDYLIIHIPALICLSISLLCFLVIKAECTINLRKKISDWNLKG